MQIYTNNGPTQHVHKRLLCKTNQGLVWRLQFPIATVPEGDFVPIENDLLLQYCPSATLHSLARAILLKI